MTTRTHMERRASIMRVLQFYKSKDWTHAEDILEKMAPEFRGYVDPVQRLRAILHQNDLKMPPSRYRKKQGPGPKAERNQQIVEAFKIGVPISSLVEQHGVTKQRIFQIASRAGLPGRRKLSALQQQERERKFKQLYLGGASCREIGEQCGFKADSTLRRLRDRLQLPVRPRFVPPEKIARREAIRQDYKDGMLYRVLSAKYNMDISTIQYYIRGLQGHRISGPRSNA